MRYGRKSCHRKNIDQEKRLEELTSKQQWSKPVRNRGENGYQHRSWLLAALVACEPRQDWDPEIQKPGCRREICWLLRLRRGEMSPPHLQRMRLYRAGCSSPCGQLEWETHTVSPKRDRDQRTQDFAGQSLDCSTITCCVATRHGVFEPTVRHGATIFRDTARQSSLAAHGPSLKVVRQSATRRIHELPFLSRQQDVDYLCEFRIDNANVSCHLHTTSS